MRVAVSIEPAVPGRWYRSNPDGRLPAWLVRCPRRNDWTEAGWAYAGAGGRRVCAQYKPGLFARPDGGVRASAYQAVLGPDVIDDYRLVELLGEGGMGVVYRAVHTRLEKEVALKVVRRARAIDPQSADRFRREMRAAGKLRHENLVQATGAMPQASSQVDKT